MAFIQFVLSFLVSGDNTTVGQILEIKGNNNIDLTCILFIFDLLIYILIWFVSEFLPEILSTGLKEDRMSIVNLILSTLKTRVSPQQLTLLI